MKIEPGTTHPYQSTISGKGALINETLVILEHLARGERLSSVRAEVLDENLLGKQAYFTRKTIWEHIGRRYFVGRSDDEIQTLAQVASSSLSAQARYLILFYAFGQADQLVHDFASMCLYDLYHDGRGVVDHGDVLQWLDRQTQDGHPEVSDWSPQTRNRVAAQLSSITRDFGLLEGAQRKRFRPVYVPLPAFIYVLYDLHAHGRSSRELVENPGFRIFLLNKDDVVFLLGEAARAGYLTFRQTESLYDIRLHYGSVKEAMSHAIAEKVP